MSLFSTLLAAAALAAPQSLPAERVAADTGPQVRVEIDSSKHEVNVFLGPYDLPNMPPMQDHAMMDHGESHDTPVHHFAWPVDGWMRGFRITLHDAQGREVPQHVMHHMIMINFSRRQLLYSAAERLLGAGTETAETSVPKTIGVPLAPNSDLGMYVAWHNDTGADLKGVTLKVTMQWTPKNQVPQPRNALPLYMDVNLTVGGSNTYDVPPGRSEKAWEFTMPIDGRVLGLGGHMHDYGSSVRLVDLSNGKTLSQVKAKRTPDGKVLGISRQLFGIRGDGLPLKAGRRYRVVGVYDNPTGHVLKNGAMAHMAGLIVPENMEDWPKLDPSDPTFQRDLADLASRGSRKPHGQEDEHAGHGTPAAADSTAAADSSKAAPAAAGHSHHTSGSAQSHDAHSHGAQPAAPAKKPAPEKKAAAQPHKH